MSKLDMDIKSIIDVERWEPLQDALAKATGTAIITVDYKGTPVTKHSLRTDFCKVMRESTVARKRCFKCDALAGLEAVRLNRPFIYLCHCGIVDAAVPVIVGEKYLGAVMFGQVRIASSDSDAKVERLLSEISSFDADSEGHDRNEMWEKYRNIPEMEYSRILEIANMIEAIVKYVVSKAVEAHTETQTYQWMLRYAAPPEEGKPPRAPGELQELREYRPDSAADTAVRPDSPIDPAVRYADSHRGQMIGMRDMAGLCHLSPSYFSKLFLRETGENYTSWLNRRKVAWAKELLRDTGDSVTRIATELGYIDTSYFIKVFKKFEGITPLVYRQYKYR